MRRPIPGTVAASGVSGCGSCWSVLQWHSDHKRAADEGQDPLEVRWMGWQLGLACCCDGVEVVRGHGRPAIECFKDATTTIPHACSGSKRALGMLAAAL